MRRIVGEQPLDCSRPHRGIVARHERRSPSARLAQRRHVPHDRGHTACVRFEQRQTEALVFRRQQEHAGRLIRVDELILREPRLYDDLAVAAMALDQPRELRGIGAVGAWIADEP